MKFNNPQRMTILGEYTPQAVIYKHESHKLHQAFRVKEGETIIQGQPVKLETDGTISGYTGSGLYLGIAITNSETPAYPQPSVEVTVMVEGFAIVYGVASAAIASCGAVAPAAPDADSLYTKYATDSQATDPKFIALNTADAAGDLIQVLIK